MRYILIFFLCATCFAAGTQTFTANINLRNLTWTSNVDQATANRERNTDCAYFFWAIGRRDLLQQSGGAFVVNGNGDLTLDPALTNAQVSSVIAEWAADQFKAQADSGAVNFQTTKKANEVDTVRKTRPRP